MIIKKVETEKEALECNNLLTKLINDERKYNNNIKNNIIINDWFQNLYNKENNIIYIAKIDEKIVGYIYVKLIIDDTNIEKEAFINGLYVLEENRNNGIATSLIKEAKKWCIDNGAKYISLNVLFKNEQAISLYKKLNFEEFLVRMRTQI